MAAWTKARNDDSGGADDCVLVASLSVSHAPLAMMTTAAAWTTVHNDDGCRAGDNVAFSAFSCLLCSNNSAAQSSPACLLDTNDNIGVEDVALDLWAIPCLLTLHSCIEGSSVDNSVVEWVLDCNGANGK